MSQLNQFERRIATANVGAQAALATEHTLSLLHSEREITINRLVQAFKESGELLTGVAKLVAISDLEMTLKHQVLKGNLAQKGINDGE